MTAMTVRFEPDDEAWVFTSGDLGPGAPVAVVIDGLRWVVSNLACASPWQVEVDADPSLWALDAVASLLGQSAADILAGGTDQAPQDITLDLGSAGRRAAMGMLALAASQPAPATLRPLDVAALAHRAGLDSLRAPLPGADRLADDAVEAWDLLPAAMHEALAGDAPPGRGACWGIARVGLANAGSFIYRVKGELLPHVDVDATFDELVRNLGPEVMAGAAEASPSLGYLGAARSLLALVVDTEIRGVVGVVASHDPDSAQVSVALTSRALALGSHAERLFVRVIGEEQAGVIGFVSLEPDPASGSARLIARLDVPDGVSPARVELVRDQRQPVVDLATAQRLNRTYELLEGQRVLSQSGSYVGDIRLTTRAWREAIAAAMTRGPLADLDDGFEPDVFPLPSDGLMAMLGEVAEEIIAGLEAIEHPAERAAMAHNTAMLASWAVMPWVQELAGDVSMIEAGAGDELSDRPVVRFVLAAKRAEAAYDAAAKPVKAAAARDYVANHGGGAS